MRRVQGAPRQSPKRAPGVTATRSTEFAGCSPREAERGEFVVSEEIARASGAAVSAEPGRGSWLYAFGTCVDCAHCANHRLTQCSQPERQLRQVTTPPARPPQRVEPHSQIAELVGSGTGSRESIQEVAQRHEHWREHTISSGAPRPSYPGDLAHLTGPMG